MKVYLIVLSIAVALASMSCGSGNSDNAGQNDMDSSGTGTSAAPPSAAVDSLVINPGLATGDLKSIIDSNMVRLSRMELTNHPTKDFALMMRVHHAGSRQLIAAALKQKMDTGLTKIARDLDRDLRSEVVMLNRFIIDRRFTDKASESAASNGLMKAMAPNSQPSMPMSGNTSDDFARLMIASLQSANDMVEVMDNADAGYNISGFSEQMVPRNERYIKVLKDWSTTK